MPTSPRGLMYKPPLKGEGDQRSWWRGSSVQYNFWGSRIETVRRNSLVPRCPPVACQRRLLPLPVSVMLIFRCFPVQTVNFIFYGVCKLVEGFTREVYFLGQPCRNRPAEFARSSLSACGLPTPVVALACIGNVDIQVLSGAGGQLYLIRRLQVCE